MKKANESIKFILELAKTQAIVGRRFDCGLGGLGLNEFTILYHLSVASEGKMRRIDLANKIGLTASGVTRLLLPMEKIGLVKSGASESDARTRFVMIAPGGSLKLKEAMERMELLLTEMIPLRKNSEIKKTAEFLADLGMRAR
ncbi:MarR family transcriptional regulator [Candidatus Saganbacteria bacterium CG08_land_8_20_14_0_20_45_16]|uniref:MarR family transcriptional regulator n=1 Tax=Candidatus Saganbacteria bacterium CG08_land_8_20_14_0_20_45_16 TaxID=2014293 RepID=A0A2H0XXV1_UNCSA|nr:MAG: MarR family transcriptional regulator [Candidatus Saganbacteria bacterium CG08_land_8_20_14_0_20_45_16]